MRKLLISAALVLAGTTASLAQGYVYYGAPYAYSPGYAVYGYTPSYYTYVPAYSGWYGYGAYDESGNSYRQPSPRSTIRAIR